MDGELALCGIWGKEKKVEQEKQLLVVLICTKA